MKRFAHAPNVAREGFSPARLPPISVSSAMTNKKRRERDMTRIASLITMTFVIVAAAAPLVYAYATLA